MVYIGTRKYKYGRMIMSHVMADNVIELMMFAHAMGLNQKHLQIKTGNKTHFDICQQKKKEAIKRGIAIEMCDKKILTKLTKNN